MAPYHVKLTHGVSTSPFQVVTETLQELNESVAGSYIEESPENLVNSNPQFFRQFTVVVATQVSHAHDYPHEAHSSIYPF